MTEHEALSQPSSDGSQSKCSAQVAMNTTISAATGGLTVSCLAVGPSSLVWGGGFSVEGAESS